MSGTFDQVLQLVLNGDVVSEHGYDEMAEDGIFVRDVVAGLKEGKVVEDYPAYPKGPCMWFGESPKGRTRRQSSSRRIVPIPGDGQVIL